MVQIRSIEAIPLSFDSVLEPQQKGTRLSLKSSQMTVLLATVRPIPDAVLVQSLASSTTPLRPC
jgi:hypothetical protein